MPGALNHCEGNASRDLSPGTCGVREPLAVDLFSGLGGWAEGLEAEGFHVRRYDIADMFAETGTPKPPGIDLVLRDVLTIHGSELADADLIVASPPCQEFSYMAMPWSRAKQIARALRGDGDFPDGYTGSRTIAELRRLFDACFRIQREACEAAGRYIPMVVENVKGAQPWVGRAAWNFGSYYLWGDLPALMPSAAKALKFNPDGSAHPPGSWFAVADSKDRGAKNAGGSWFNIGSPGQKVTGQNPDGRKVPGFRFDGSGKSFQSESVNRHVSPEEGFKSKGMDWSNRSLRGQDFTAIAGAQAAAADGIKNKDADGYDRSHPHAFGLKAPRTTSKGSARKAASAKIAKIPEALSRHIARVYLPARAEAA